MINTPINLFIKSVVLLINIIGIWLTFLVNERSAHKKESNLFSLMVFLMFIWVDFAYLSRISPTEIGLWCIRFAWAITPLFFVIIYLFFSIFQTEIHPKINSLTLTAIGIINIPLVLFTSWIIHHIYFTPKNILAINYGQFAWLFFAEVIILTILSCHILIKKYFLLESKEKRIKIQYVLVGFLFFFLMNSVFNIIFPFFLKIFHFYEFGDYSTIILLGLIAYTIIKHRLFGIKVILSELFSGLAITILFIDLLLSKSISEYIWKGILFVGFAIFGELMTRAMIREEQQKEKLQKIHNQLEKSYQKLKRLDQAKSEFLSIATHQLRSPLTATINVISTLLEEDWGKLNSTQKKYLQEIYHRSKKMTQLINNLLNLSRIELGRMKFNFQKIDLVETTNEIIDELECKVEAKNKKIKFKYNQPKRQKLFVSADRFQIQQIIQNFITNAFHYTNYGEIEVKIYPKNNSVIFSVQDTGIGLSKNEKEIIFEKFRRGKRAQNQYTEGSGLGLYLATKIIKAHHGRIWVKSKGENQGSTFYFSLPLAKATKE